MQRALIIKPIWLNQILEDEAKRKTWEMRSAATNIRGTIGLIESGTGFIVGQADITGSLGPLTADEYDSWFYKHRIPPDLTNIKAKYLHAWRMENAKRYKKPVKYKHPSGAVIWVTLTEKDKKRINEEIGSG